MTVKVSTQEELSNISEIVNVRLTNDIVLTEDFDTIDDYKGTFDGNGHTIYNIKQLFSKIRQKAMIKNVNIATSELEKPLICKKNLGTIENIKVKDCSISSSSLVRKNQGNISNCKVIDSEIKEMHNVGGLAEENTGLIKNCELIDSKVVAKERFGGIVGLNLLGGEVKNCDVISSTIKKKPNSEVGLKSGLEVGGICGYNAGAEEILGVITDCAIKNTDVKGIFLIGGIAGSNSGLISNVSVDTCIEGGNAIGGITGKNTDLIKNCEVEGKIVGEKQCGSLVGTVEGGVCKNLLSKMKIFINSDTNTSGVCIGEISESSTLDNCYYYGSNIYEIPLVGNGDGSGLIDATDISKQKVKALSVT